jgi:hypothetical protein
MQGWKQARLSEDARPSPLDSDKLEGSEKEERGNTVSSMLLRGRLAVAVLGRHQFARQLCAPAITVMITHLQGAPEGPAKVIARAGVCRNIEPTRLHAVTVRQP